MPLNAKTFHKMKATASGLEGVVENLTNTLWTLDAEIKADAEGKHEYRKAIRTLEVKRAALQARFDANAAWSHMYDRDIGPFQSKNEKNVAGIAVIYDKARACHASGIEVLKEEFAYHPLFKHPGDTFNAVPFAPKKLG
jgi:hypothetical protein